jgi:hypothetical protein
VKLPMGANGPSTMPIATPLIENLVSERRRLRAILPRRACRRRRQWSTAAARRDRHAGHKAQGRSRVACRNELDPDALHVRPCREIESAGDQEVT